MKDERDRFSIAFPFRFDKPGKDVAFAFAYPFSLSDHENLMRCLEAEIRSGPASLYFRRHRLCMSLEGRHVDLLTITEKDDENPIEEALHDSGSDIPDARTCRIQDRQVFILTARVRCFASFEREGWLILGTKGGWGLMVTLPRFIREKRPRATCLMGR